MAVSHLCSPFKRLKISLKTLLFALLILTMSEGKATVVLRGDLNRDGKVNVSDAIVALQLSAQLLPLTPEDRLIGDVAPAPGQNGRLIGDGAISITDAIRILLYSAQLLPVADFLAGEDPGIDTASTTLNINTYALRSRIYSGTAGEEIPVSVVLSNADALSMGGLTLSIKPLNGSPPLKIIRVEAGKVLPTGTELLTSPQHLPAEGTTIVRGAFSLAEGFTLMGAGEIFRFIVKADSVIPITARYELNLSNADFATETADSLTPSPLIKPLNSDG